MPSRRAVPTNDYTNDWSYRWDGTYPEGTFNPYDPSQGQQPSYGPASAPPQQSPEPPPAPKVANRDSIMGILSQYDYGAPGLQAAERQLNDLGVNLQYASDGSLRGRAYLPSGEQVDLFDPREGNDFAHRPTGSSWDYRSMGFPSSAPAAPPPAPVPAATYGFSSGPSSSTGLSNVSAGTSGGGSSFTKPAFGDQAGLAAALSGLFPGGAFNQGIVDRRTDSARASLERTRKGRQENNQAYLAERGLIGSGPEQTAYQRQNEDLDAQYRQSVGDIYASESQNADARMIQALQIAAGLSESEAANIVDQFRAQTERDIGQGQLNLGQQRLGLDERLGMGRLGLDTTLGMGNLALGNLGAVNSYNLGLANYGLARDQFQYGQQNNDIDNYIQLLQLLLSGSNVAAGGFA